MTTIKFFEFWTVYRVWTLVALLALAGLLFGCDQPEPVNHVSVQVEVPESAAPEVLAAEQPTSFEDDSPRQASLLRAERAALEAQRAELDIRRANLESTARRNRQVAEARPVAVPAPAAVPEPPRPRLMTLEVPAGTALDLVLDQSISSQTARLGQAVYAHTVGDVTVGGQLVIPSGTRVRGVVTEVVAGKKIGGRARLTVRFDRLTLPSGHSSDIDAWFGDRGRSSGGKDATAIGIGTAGGAILGNVIDDDDRGRNTAIGGVVGGAIGSVVAATNKPHALEYAAGQPLQVRLEHAAHLTVES